jgi:hypothetical protein
VSGVVLDADGNTLAEARVFLEPGLTGTLRSTQTDARGRFEFEDVAPGPVGLFAVAEGWSFNGAHLNLSVAEQVPPVAITLHRSGKIEGKVVDPRGKAIEGARITRLVLMGSKIGIPLAKLKALGFTEPTSDQRGHYSIDQLPQKETVLLKVGHPAFAQEGVADVPVGDDNFKITLYPGVLVMGEVLTDAERTSIPQARVIFNNVFPPHDTATTHTDGQGKFSIRLRAGEYAYWATSPGRQSPGAERFMLTGRSQQEQLRLYLGEAGHIRGTVKDAVSGKAVAGVVISLFSNGNKTAVTRTGPTGVYIFEAVAGENIVQLKGGSTYRPPESGTLKVQVEAGQEMELPTQWLVPLPKTRVQVLDEHQKPLAGAIVSLLQPYQLGWRQSDASGWVELNISELPPNGKIVGRVEHHREPFGALFSLETANSAEAKVQLLPLTSLTGQVKTRSGKPVAGAIVGGLYPGASDEEALGLWRCLSVEDGSFSWNAVIPGVPQRCLIWNKNKIAGESGTFIAEAHVASSIPTIEVERADRAVSFLGKKLSWYSQTLLCGPLAPRSELKARPAVIYYADAREADIVIEILSRAKELIKLPNLSFAVMVDGPYSRTVADIPVFSGKAPTAATTYVLDSEGRVVLESYGMPPVSLLNQVATLHSEE